METLSRKTQAPLQSGGFFGKSHELQDSQRAEPGLLRDRSCRSLSPAQPVVRSTPAAAVTRFCLTWQASPKGC